MSSLKERVENELRGRKASEVTELTLDNCSSGGRVEGVTDDFSNLEELSLIGTGINTLAGFPKLPNLKILELADNRISAGLNFLAGCPSLTHLNLANNRLKLDALAPLKALPLLERLDLENNEAAQGDDYRAKIFAQFPTLKVIDNQDKDGNELSDDDDDDEDDEEGDDYDDDDDGEEGGNAPNLADLLAGGDISDGSDEGEYEPGNLNPEDDDIDDDSQDEQGGDDDEPDAKRARDH